MTFDLDLYLQGHSTLTLKIVSAYKVVLSATLWRSSQECTQMGMLTTSIKNHAEFVVSQHILDAQLSEGPGEGTASMLGVMDVPPFWHSFLTSWGLNTIFLGYLFSFTNTKTNLWSLWPQIPLLPRSFWVQFSMASSTPPSIFRPRLLYSCESTHADCFISIENLRYGIALNFQLGEPYALTHFPHSAVYMRRWTG